MPYAVSKSAVNMVNAKYAAEFQGRGFAFLAISPGFVETWDHRSKPALQAHVLFALTYAAG